MADAWNPLKLKGQKPPSELERAIQDGPPELAELFVSGLRPSQGRLVHYTTRISKLVGILTGGFVWVARHRGVVQRLLPDAPFGQSEPNQLGMLSFTDQLLPPTGLHTGKATPFGLVMSPEWAIRRNARQVIYVPESGRAFEALRELFALAYRDMLSKIPHPEDGFWQFMQSHPGMAGFGGARLWSELISLLAYMEPAEYAHQREWRVVSEIPMSGIPATGGPAVAQAMPRKGWGKVDGIFAVDVSPADVLALVCPKARTDALRDALPHGYRTTEIVAY